MAKQHDCAAVLSAHSDPLDQAAQAALAVLTGGLSPASMTLAFLDWVMHSAMAPGKWLDLSLQLSDAWSAAVPGYAHHAADVADPRFSNAGWAHWPYCLFRDGFLRAQRWWHEATTGVPGVSRHHEDIVNFSARQWLDACSPSNIAMLNPAVLETAVRTGGSNFAAGARNWIEDFADIARALRGERVARQSDYRPGHELAITPGKVVWRNALCELLQYTPTSKRVAREPIFIVPSWIMKYYILDLQPHNSLIRFLVDAGFTVFTVSWRNPDASDRDLALNDYLTLGILEPLAQVRARCEGEPVHAVGYCLGGTLLAIAAAALARDGASAALRSITLLAAQTDFSAPGELGLFIDASELAALDALMWRQGYLDGSQMAAAFQLLNARDLIWSRMMSEYLLGRRSKPNDLMAWNADATRMPYRMHIEYLNGLLLNNDLAEGRYCVDGRPVALSDIETPAFIVGTERDHVSPWRSVYKLHLLTHNEMTFLLTAGGHNAGIVSEPGHAGRYYRCAIREPDAPYRSRHDFFEDTPPVDGSWWPRWAAWLQAHSSGAVDARQIDGALADAPGSYVLEP
ncbi:poly-beta-hydroxybutyrate polymerase [Paraburkholderia sp. SOS3]|nr:alpha/beta fold hydrolase [Paraburkholderia sp. SOS3]APR40322.1 poly-beta-hydroxybutyrate polymerase [Paraburkholderia sp. SOS3]